MKKPKIILCHHCKQPIQTKEELAVVGNGFLTYHNKCFDSIKHSNTYAFYSGYKSNGYFPWLMIIVLNILLWGTYTLYHPPFYEVLTMSLFISTMVLFYRLTAYLLYERHY